MATSSRGTETAPRPGLVESLKGYLATWVDLFRTRLDLFTTELEEESQRIQQIAILAATSVLCLAFGAVLATLFVVVAFWETRFLLPVLGGFALLYLASGSALALFIRRKVRNKPKMFSASLAELAKDSRHLSSGL